MTWVPELQLYRCRWSERVPGAALLDQLLHGCRGFPGSPVLAECPAWPAFDDDIVLGYLLPAEVQRLDAEARELGRGPHERVLRELVRVAAERGLCLVTLQAGLIL